MAHRSGPAVLLGLLFFSLACGTATPVQQSVFDGLTGIWASRRSGDSWTEPERILLTETGEWALDGCEIVRGDRMDFCLIRAGNSREIEWYYATWIDGEREDVKGAGEWMNGPAEVGEMHITEGYRDIYFASKGGSGLGGFDIWAAHSTADGWSEPENLGPAVNTAGDENRPFVTEDGRELWFDSSSRSGKVGPAVFRCLRQADPT